MDARKTLHTSPHGRAIESPLGVCWKKVSCYEKVRSVSYSSVPVPLGIPTSGRCLGFDPDNYTVIIAGDCSVMFSYDEQSLREITTTRTICPNDLTSGTVAILANICEYTLKYAYGTRGGSRICVTISPNLCLDVTGYTTGNVLLFVDSSAVLFTYIYKGKWS